MHSVLASLPHSCLFLLQSIYPKRVRRSLQSVQASVSGLYYFPDILDLMPHEQEVLRISGSYSGKENARSHGRVYIACPCGNRRRHTSVWFFAIILFPSDTRPIQQSHAREEMTASVPPSMVSSCCVRQLVQAQAPAPASPQPLSPPNQPNQTKHPFAQTFTRPQIASSSMQCHHVSLPTSSRA